MPSGRARPVACEWNDLVTWDTSSGLEWLDLSSTLGMGQQELEDTYGVLGFDVADAYPLESLLRNAIPAVAASASSPELAFSGPGGERHEGGEEQRDSSEACASIALPA